MSQWQCLQQILNRDVCCAAEEKVIRCREEMQAALKRQLADPLDLAADLERGFKLEQPAVVDAAQRLADTSSDPADFAELDHLLARLSKKRRRS